MDRLLPTLVLLLIVCVLGLGFVIFRADQHSRDDARRQACIEKVQTLATISLMAPAKRIDEKGRISTMQGLGKRLDAC